MLSLNDIHKKRRVHLVDQPQQILFRFTRKKVNWSIIITIALKELLPSAELPDCPSAWVRERVLWWSRLSKWSLHPLE